VSLLLRYLPPPRVLRQHWSFLSDCWRGLAPSFRCHLLPAQLLGLRRAIFCQSDSTASPPTRARIVLDNLRMSAYERLLELADRDARLLGVILSGSRGRDTAAATSGPATGHPPALVLDPPERRDAPAEEIDQVRIPFDVDAVLFDRESERYCNETGWRRSSRERRNSRTFPWTPDRSSRSFRALGSRQERFAGRSSPIRRRSPLLEVTAFTAIFGGNCSM
jgi:5'-nucleotidase